MTNTTDSEQVLRSEKRFDRLVAEVSDYAIFTLDAEGQITSWNRGATLIKGYTAAEVLGRHFSMLYDPADAARGLPAEELRRAALEGRHESEGWRVQKSGERFWANAVITAVHDAEGRAAGFVKITRDLTERQRAAELVQRSLQEKELLLQEIHHRVKNNLQVISSLLKLQAEQLADPAAARAFKDSQARVRSIALLHEKLSQSTDLASIGMDAYLRELAGDLVRTYGPSADEVDVETDASGIALGIDLALPCALIVNELVTNSFKHAFAGRRGRVWVRMERRGDELTLSVSDDGKGLPAGVDPDDARTLGMHLIRTLGRQLEATVRFGGEGGARCEVRFKAPAPEAVR